MTTHDWSRRDFVSAALLLAAMPALAQQSGIGKHRIVYVADESTGRSEVGAEHFTIVMDRLAQHGYAAGRNLEAKHVVWKVGDMDLDGAMRDILAWRPEVVVPQGTLMARAAMKATTTVPVVFMNVGDPIRSGLVSSMAKPAANVTGVTQHQRDPLLQEARADPRASSTGEPRRSRVGSQLRVLPWFSP